MFLQRFITLLLLVVSIVHATKQENEGVTTHSLKIRRELVPIQYISLSMGLTVLSVVCFMYFACLYTIHNGCPRDTHYTEVWRVDRNEQLSRFKFQKRAEELLRERERRKVNESTRE